MDDAPEFKLDLDIPAAGGWLSLAWDSSLVASVRRPLLVFEQRDAAGAAFETDILLAGTSFGRQYATVHVPAGTSAIRFMPGVPRGEFGLRLNEARWISPLEAFRRGVKTQPFSAFHALGAWLIRRPDDFRLLLGEAIGARAFADYPRWKAERSRPPEWQGLDALALPGVPRLRLVALGWAGDPAALATLPADWRPDWRMHRKGADWRLAYDNLADDDLLVLVPPETMVRGEALPAVLRAAAENPAALLFFGDDEIEGVGGKIACRFLSGFDPLITFQRLASSAVFAIRVRALRLWAEGKAPPENPGGVALHRPLACRPASLRSSGAPDGLLEWLASGWALNAHRGDEEAQIAVLIPTRDRPELLRACIESIEPTLPQGGEIIIIDNESREPETLAFLRDFSARRHRKVLPVPGPFNFSKLCNAGARMTEARLLVFLNNDTTALAADWVRQLRFYALRPECGAVGARLLYPSGRLQHGGVVIGIGGYAGHVDLHIAGDADGHFERARCDHSLLAVTGACLAVEKEKFEAVGGFDEENLPVDLNDIDLCLRLHEKGWRNIYAAGAKLVHHESASRGRKSMRYRKERTYFAVRWRAERQADPYFHPALSLLLTRPSLG